MIPTRAQALEPPATAPSEDQVRAARDLGASQFIARPFTIEVLCDRLDWVTGDMRDFVKNRDYFGPDRRHHFVPVELDLHGGDGGKIGRKLVHELHRANRKVVRRAPDRQLTGSG